MSLNTETFAWTVHMCDPPFTVLGILLAKRMVASVAMATPAAVSVPPVRMTNYFY